MRYRAILIDPGATNQERPLEIDGNDFGLITEWAAKVLQGAVAQLATVTIFQMRETVVDVLHKPKPILQAEQLPLKGSMNV